MAAEGGQGSARVKLKVGAEVGQPSEETDELVGEWLGLHEQVASRVRGKHTSLGVVAAKRQRSDRLGEEGFVGVLKEEGEEVSVQGGGEKLGDVRHHQFQQVVI